MWTHTHLTPPHNHQFRKAHPGLQHELDVLLEEVLTRFRPRPDEDLLSTLHTLLQRCYQSVFMSLDEQVPARCVRAWRGGGGRLGWGVVCWLDGCIVGLQRLILFNYYPTHPTPPPPTNNQHSLRETLTRIGKRYFRGASTDAAAGPAGKSARARQSQALVDTFRAAFERDFRTSTASGPEEKEQQQQQEQQPLSIQEVWWKGGDWWLCRGLVSNSCSLGFLLMLTPTPQNQPALQTKPRTHRSSWC